MKYFLISDDGAACEGLRLAGVDCKKVNGREQAARQLEEAVLDESIGILLITPGIKRMCGETVEKIRGLARPILVEIPDSSGAPSESTVEDYIKSTVGISI